MAKRQPSGQLKVEPIAEDDNPLEQLLAAVQRIVDGLDAMHAAVKHMEVVIVNCVARGEATKP